jgi:3-deoxy-manno-octulosonate cytidylyltransferase (CMP-KDO synthetase)
MNPSPVGGGFLFERDEESMDRTLVVIPARYGSTRFPGKALADLAGKPLVVRVAQRAARMRTAAKIVIATDDQRIFAAVEQAGFGCEMTADHATGTDRVGEVAARHEDYSIVINLQGDEPLLAADDADALVLSLKNDPGMDMATLAHPFTNDDQWLNPHFVKVLVDRQGCALYFSRAAVPGTFPGGASKGAKLSLRHVGIYAYRRAALRRFLKLPRGPLEQAEGLEQLRAIEHGMRIKVLEISHVPIGVDTPAELELVRRLWRDDTSKP